jgi:hypothetical protein
MLRKSEIERDGMSRKSLSYTTVLRPQFVGPRIPSLPVVEDISRDFSASARSPQQPPDYVSNSMKTIVCQRLGF